jgi:nucleoside-triphosphatase THEP1
MVYIITGKINEGKTTKLLSIFNKIKYGDGFINQKVFVDGVNAGQEIMRLSTGEKRYFSLKDGYMPDTWNEKVRYGSYSFSEEGFAFAEKIIRDVIENRTEPVFIDEIGPLELQGAGFHDLFSALLEQKIKIYAAIRESCLENAIQKFAIEDYVLIKA